MSANETPINWHLRFAQQARWTEDVRRFLFTRAAIDSARRVLDVGCGTGVLLDELEGNFDTALYGIDIASNYIKMAMRNTQRSFFTQSDAHALPYPSQSFDLAYCHFLLLWVSEPWKVVQEMARVVRPGGAVLALAEPDYGGRIDYPSELEELGQAQHASLAIQGADPLMGRKLSEIFHQAGLTSIETGVLGGNWTSSPLLEEWQDEWRVVEHDLQQTSELIPNPEVLKKFDWVAWQAGKRVLFVPTFYAFGLVPL